MNWVFVWRSRAWYAPTGGIEEIHFGLMDLQTGVWHSRIIARWPDPASKQTVFQAGLAGMAAVSHLHGLGRKMEELSRTGVSAERFAVLLSACGFIDSTPYQQPVEEYRQQLQDELERARRCVETLEDRLATGYYHHN